MENINGWTKRLLLGPDEQSWKNHSPNLMCAHRCNNFEMQSFIKNRFECDEVNKPQRKYNISQTTKTIEPRAVIEKKRIYEWSIRMFDIEVANRTMSQNESHSIIDDLSTPLKAKPTLLDNNVDVLEECIDNIFYNNKVDDDEEEDVDSMTNGNEVIDDEEDIDEIDDTMNDDEGVEVNTNKSHGDIHRLSIVNIFEEGRKELHKMGVQNMRLNRKKRLARCDKFHIKLNEIVLSQSENFEDDCNSILSSTQSDDPWYRSVYKMML